MMSGGYGGGMPSPMNPFSAIGQNIMPVAYAPPVRYHGGYYGMVQQHTGLMQGLSVMAGIGTVPRGTFASDYTYNVANDLGQRSAGALVGGASALGGIIAGAAMSPAGTYVGGAVGGAVGGMFGPMGAMAGAAIGGFVGGIASYGVGMAASNAVNMAVGGRQDIQSFLESNSFRFVSPGSSMGDTRTGGGMNRGARMEVSGFIRQQDIRDPLMNTRDLTQVLEQGTQLGLFNGTKDMDDFKEKFKSITEAVKTVTKVMHQTLSEGLKTIKDLKGIGVTGGDVTTMVMQADTMGRASGRTGAETLGLGLQGAEMFRGTGVSMGVGAQATMMNLASVRASRDAGFLSQEAIAQAGGEEALAMRQTASGLAYAQSSTGRGFNAAFFSGGGFNAAGFTSSMMAGGGSYTGMAMQAAGNIGNVASQISYSANQAKFTSEMASTFGGQGLQMAGMGMGVAQAKFLMGVAPGLSGEDAYRYSALQAGRSTSEIDAEMAKIRGRKEVFSSEVAAAGATRDKMVEEGVRKNNILYMASARVGDMLKSGVDLAATPANILIEKTKQTYSEIGDRLSGIQRANISGVDLTTKSTTGLGADALGPADLDRGGLLSGTTSGRQLAERLSVGGVATAEAKMLGIEMRTISKDAVTNDMAVLRHHGDTVDVVNKSDLSKRDVLVSIADAEKMDLKGVKAGKLRGFSSMDDAASQMFGTSFNKLSAKQKAKLVLETKGTDEQRIVDRTRDAQVALNTADSGVGVGDMKSASLVYDEAVKDLGLEAGAVLPLTASQKMDQLLDPRIAAQSKSRLKFAEGVLPNLAESQRLRAAGKTKESEAAFDAAVDIQRKTRGAADHMSFESITEAFHRLDNSSAVLRADESAATVRDLKKKGVGTVDAAAAPGGGATPGQVMDAQLKIFEAQLQAFEGFAKKLGMK
jgi:hypothetical protein